MSDSTVIASPSRPIIFTGESVRAIISGSKTQTRRVVKPQPFREPFRIRGAQPDLWFNENREYPRRGCMMSKTWRCPYGGEGDRVWVKETWRPVGQVLRNGRAVYAADEPWAGGPWRSPLFMPRQASRLELEIFSVRVERVQVISEQDADREGCPSFQSQSEFDGPGITARDVFRERWDEINGKRAGCRWQDNPWVWAVEFRRVEKGGAA